MTTESKFKVLRLAPSAEAELQAVCVHEAAHEIVSEYFNLNPASFVAGLREGVCLHTPGTPLQNAAIGWGGTVGEDLLERRVRQRTLPQVKLTSTTLTPWCDEMLCSRLRELSPQDADAIRGHAPALQSCKLAFDILASRVGELQITARWLADKSRQRVGLQSSAADAEYDVAEFLRERGAARTAALQRANLKAIEAAMAEAVPTPKTWPVDVEAFLRLIIIGEACRPVTVADVKRLKAFAAHLCQAGGTADLCSAIFSGPAEWKCAVHAYRAWLARNTPNL